MGATLTVGCIFAFAGGPTTEAKTPPGLTLAMRVLRGLAVDGVGDGIEEAEAGNVGVVIERDAFVGAEVRGPCFLRLAHAGEDGGAGLFGDEDGGATHAAQCAGDEDGLALLNLRAERDELFAGGDDKREGGGVDEVEAVGKVHKVGRVDDAELRVGAQGEGQDLVTGREALDLCANAADGAGEVAPEDGGELDGKTFLGGTAAHLVTS